MTTNDAIEFARKSFEKLGYKIEECHLNENPARVEGPFDLKTLGHIPFCRVIWQSPEANTTSERMRGYTVQFNIDLQKKLISGMSLSGTNFFRPNLQVDVKPEFESEYRKKIQKQMTINTNFPAHLKKHLDN